MISRSLAPPSAAWVANPARSGVAGEVVGVVAGALCVAFDEFTDGAAADGGVADLAVAVDGGEQRPAGAGRGNVVAPVVGRGRREIAEELADVTTAVVDGQDCQPVGERARRTCVGLLAAGQCHVGLGGAGGVGLGGVEVDQQDGMAGAVVVLDGDVVQRDRGEFGAAQGAGEADEQQQGVAAAGDAAGPAVVGPVGEHVGEGGQQHGSLAVGAGVAGSADAAQRQADDVGAGGGRQAAGGVHGGDGGGFAVQGGGGVAPLAAGRGVGGDGQVDGDVERVGGQCRAVAGGTPGEPGPPVGAVGTHGVGGLAGAEVLRECFGLVVVVALAGGDQLRGVDEDAAGGPVQRGPDFGGHVLAQRVVGRHGSIVTGCGFPGCSGWPRAGMIIGWL